MVSDFLGRVREWKGFRLIFTVFFWLLKWCYLVIIKEKLFFGCLLGFLCGNVLGIVGFVSLEYRGEAWVGDMDLGKLRVK